MASKPLHCKLCFCDFRTQSGIMFSWWYFMAFNNPDEVLEKFNLTYHANQFINFNTIKEIKVATWFAEDIAFALQNRGVDDKYFFIQEFITAPCLKEAWKRHEKLNLFSHPQIKADDWIVIPDYLVSPKAAHGYKRLGKPLLLTVEAKDEDFDQGWTQAIFEAVICQKINNDLEIPIWCIVTTGDTWQFGKLFKNDFYKHPYSVSLANLGQLLAILDELFSQCDQFALY